MNQSRSPWTERLRRKLGLPPTWKVPRHTEHLRLLLEHQGHLVTEEELLEDLEEAFTRAWPRTWGAMAPRAARGRATKELAALDALAFEERFEAVRTEENPKRFASPELARRLLVRSREALPGDLEASETWARLALEVATRGDSPDHRARAAHAWAFRANARRAQGRLQEASDGSGEVDRLVKETVPCDPRLLVDLDDLGASLTRDLGELTGALRLLERLCTVAQLLEDERLMAKGLIGQGIALNRSGDFHASIERSADALQRLRHLSGHDLSVHAVINLSFGLCGLLRFEEAAELLEKQPRRDDDRIQVRLEWIMGAAARGLGQWSRAEELLEATLKMMITWQRPYEVALVGLDLAAIYLTIGASKRLESLTKLVERALIQVLSSHPGSAHAYIGFHECLQSMSTEDLGRRYFLLAFHYPQDVDTWPQRALSPVQLP